MSIMIPVLLLISIVSLVSVQNTEASTFLLSLPKTIIAFWPADGNATDVTGHGHNGVLSGGVTYGPGKTKQAFVLDGTSGFVNVGSLGVDNTNKPFSIVAWIYPKYSMLHDGGAHTIVQQGSTASNSNANGEFMVDFDVGTNVYPGKLELEIGSTQTFSQAKVVQSTLTPGKWTFVAATYDGSQTPGGMKLYINGVEQSSVLLGSGFTGTAAPRDQWSIGAQGYAPTPIDFFKGKIDDVKIFSCALNSTEVMAQFHGNNRATCKTPTIQVGNSPTGIGVNTQTNKIYVANENDNNVSVIDLNTNNVIKTIQVGARPLDVEVNTQTNKIYVANYNSNNVTVVSGSTDNVLTTIPVDTLPVGLAVNEVTNKIYVGHANSNIVSVINGSTNKVISTIQVGSSPEFVAVNPNTNTIYVANELSDNVSVINGSTNAVIATITVGDNPEFVKADPGLNQIYVANSLSGTVSVISGTTNTVVATVQVGNLDAALGVNTVTHKVYVTNQGDHNVSVIDGTTKSVIATIPTSLAGPDYLAVNSATNKVYIADILSNIVAILDGL